MSPDKKHSHLRSRIFVAGHKGMVGSAICRQLKVKGATDVVVADRSVLDLTDSASVLEFLSVEKIESIYLAAAKVGGIHANNTYPADFIRDNLAIQLAVVDAAYKANVDRLLFLGSSCIYPRMSEQPIKEEFLMTGALEPTNEAYAIAKIAGIKLCESYNRQYGCDFRSVMPTNLYGPNDNFHPENSHVVPALIRRFHEARESGAEAVVVWGSGKPMREFLYVDDMADACIHVMEADRARYEAVTNPMETHINIGTGEDCTIETLASTIARVVGYEGVIEWDATKPDGTPRKLLSVDRADKIGWESTVELEQGLRKTYEWFCHSEEKEILRGF